MLPLLFLIGGGASIAIAISCFQAAPATRQNGLTTPSTSVLAPALASFITYVRRRTGFAVSSVQEATRTKNKNRPGCRLLPRHSDRRVWLSKLT